ncbi:polysaccharide deacetylase family protein [Clostridium chromiireducens]|nr:polysaccharide deacetylase family protein [Clostridium chromiireducens]
MRSKLKYILILASTILLIGCTFGKSMSSPENQSNNEQSERKYEEVDEKEINQKPNSELSKNSDENKGKATPNTNEEFAEITTPESSKIVEEDKNFARSKKKIIYLTFDDGPSSKVTSTVLDILKENRVKATFFLIGNQIKGREAVVKRIYNEGNSIGLHSYTHNYEKIYSDENNFIKEMVACRNEINKVVGISPNIIRFPGGSHKRLSYSFLKKLHERNFKVYDWNLENSDGLKPKTAPDELYLKAIKGSEKKDNSILLLHCTDNHQNTCKALPRIIKYYKSKGYEFRTITEETKELYFPIKK